MHVAGSMEYAAIISVMMKRILPALCMSSSAAPAQMRQTNNHGQAIKLSRYVYNIFSGSICRHPVLSFKK